MSFKCTAEILITFLKLRNIDLLQQGLYNVSVTARVKDNSDKKSNITPLDLRCSDVSGRRGMWEDTPNDLYPDAEILYGKKIIYTRTFFVRFQEQVEVLDEVAAFKVEFDINKLLRTWKDGVVLTFDLWHCSKEDVEKLPAYHFERELEDGNWESYSDSACATIMKGIQKGKQVIKFKHRSVKHIIQNDPENDILVEIPTTKKTKTREVRKSPKVYPRSAFEKVATREICIQNVCLPHTEWIPVVWQNWYAATCHVLVHTNIISMEYVPPAEVPSNSYELTSSTGFLAAAKWALLGEVPEGRNQEIIIRFFHTLVSYLSYSYFYCVNWSQRLNDKPKPNPSFMAGCDTFFADIRKKLLEKEIDESENGKPKGDSILQYVDPMAGTPDTEESETPHKHGNRNNRCITNLTSDHAIPAYERVTTIRETPEPPIAVKVKNPCSEDIEKHLLMSGGTQTPSTSWLSNGMSGSDQLSTVISHAVTATLELTEKFEAIIEQEDSEAKITETFVSMLSSLSHENAEMWKMLSRHLPLNTSLMMTYSKKCFWRTETLRSKRAITSAAIPSTVTDVLKPLQSTSGNLRIPDAIPPYVQMTFSYPEHTFVEYELLSVGIPKGTLLAHGKKAGDLQLSRSQKESVGSDEGSDQAPRRSETSDPRVEKLLNIVSSGGDDADSSIGTHLIVFVHGYKGNKYDLRALRNHLALSLSGSNYLVARSLEDYADENISKLGDILADEVEEYIRSENLKIGRLSFIGHSMGTIVIRAAIQCQVMEKYLRYLHTFVSLSGPHLGVADAESVRVSSALWILSTVWQSANIKQLRLDTPFLHSLSATDNIGMFKHVVLLSSDDDDFVSRQSATLDFGAAAGCRNPQKASLVEDMLRNLTMQLTLCTTVLRFNVRFHPVGRPELSTAMQRAVGKSVHVAFLANPDFIHTFVCLFRHFFV
eukprot:TRINITY_DN2145_c2_g2_i1.p1 TRINITY_DN2145_c2_g2~~TRINITY_DN2145_c2_g2_i1.p1  ORF type:complete len:937 (+),score=137.10 TRINITY_DN2145_c2_g2_i1:112-2922(+)